MHQPDDKYDLSVLEEMGYERRDVQVERSQSFVVWFFVSVFATFAITAGFMWWLQPGLVGTKPLPVYRRLPAAPNPLLQSNRTAWQDMKDVKQREKQALNAYSWIDKEKGVVSVPINEAREMVLSEGLPTRANAKEPSAGQ